MKIDYIGTCTEDVMLKTEKEIILFGCGKRSKDIFKYIANNWGTNRIVCFVDNDQAKQGMFYQGVPIVSLNESRKISPDAAYVITTVCVREIVCQLEKMNVSKVHIICGVEN